MAYSQLPISPAQIPLSFNFATHIVDYWARRDPNLVALKWVDQSLSNTKDLTYAHFSRESNRIAILLTNLGLKPGDICIVILPRIPEWWEIATACLRSGVILCPCTTLLVDKDIEYRLQVSHASAFIGDETAVSKVLKIRSQCPNLKQIVQIGGKSSSEVVDFHTALSKIPPNSYQIVPGSLTPTSPAVIFFTSGTTGPPKMVLHSQISYPLAHAMTGVHWLQLSPDKVYWNLSEQGWAKAAWSFFSTWNCGATLFVHDDRMAFNPRRTLEVLHKFPITTLCAPPTVYRQLVLDENRKFFQSPEGRPKALEHCCGAGEPLNEGVIRTWKDITGGMEIFDGYGQTESILTCGNQKQNPVRPGSMGKPIPGVPLRVVDSNGNESKEGDEGDITIEIIDKGPNTFFGIFEGYIDKSSGKIDPRIRSFPNGRSYYFTGDRASRDKDGYLWFVGRSDDVINSSGYRIGKKHCHFVVSFFFFTNFQTPGPFEVESTLKLHPSVVESAVVASPDPQRDEVVKAFIVLTSSAASKLKADSSATSKLIDELQSFCKTNAAPYKYPRKIEFVDASFLPKTISGKIKRAELKRLERQRYQDAMGKGKL